MKLIWNRNVPLKRILYFSSGIVVLTVSLTGIISSITLFSMENSKQTKLIQDRLSFSIPHVKEVIFRQALGTKDQDIDTINRILTEQQRLLDISLIALKKKNDCKALASSTCVPSIRNFVTTQTTFEEQIGSGLEEYIFILGKEKPRLPLLPIMAFIFSIAAILFIGVLIQRRILTNKILLPVLALVDGIRSEQEPINLNGWPTEFLMVYRQLKALVQEREDASRKTVLQDLERNEEAQYIAGAYDSLHYAKTVLMDVLKYIENIDEMPPEIRGRLKEMINRPSGWINKLLSEQNRKKQSHPTLKVLRTDVSRITALGAVLHGIEKDYRDKAQHRRISFRADFPKSLFHQYCQINYNALYSAITNICSNAFDAVESREQRDVHLSASLTGENNEICEIQIKDTGTPFDATALNAVNSREKFTTKQNGSGFGILSSRTILEQVGGKVTILPFDEYKIIKLTIPLVDRPDWIFDFRSVTGKEVLILDDEPMIDRVQRNLPIDGENRVEQFYCEQEFVSAWRKKPNSLLLVDYDYGNTTKKGIDLILEHSMNAQAVILSGRVLFNPSILNRTIETKIKIYPKDFLH